MTLDSAHAPPFPRPPNWRTAAQLERQFIGSHAGIARLMDRVRNALVVDLEASGFPPAAAAALVGDHLLKVCRLRQGRDQLAASPDAVRLLGLTARAAVEPVPPGGWRSSAQLSRDLRLDFHQLNRQAARLYHQSVDALCAGGYSEAEATDQVGGLLLRPCPAIRGRRRIWFIRETAVPLLWKALSPGSSPAAKVSTWEHRWKALLQCVVTDMVSSGYPVDDAVAAVREQYSAVLTDTSEAGFTGRGTGSKDADQR